MSLAGAASGLAVPDDALVRAVVVVAGVLLVRPAVALIVSLATLASTLPGGLGRAAGALTAALRPGIARRLLAAALGLAVPAISAVGSAPPAAAHVLDTGSARAGAVGAISATGTITASIMVGTAGAAATRVAALPGVARRAEVVVAPGDTLWDIARRHLPLGAGASAVSRAWPQWYSANRDRIGPDPSILLVGTPLRVPDPPRTDPHRTHLRRTGTSASQHHSPPPAPAPSRASAQSLDPDRR